MKGRPAASRSIRVHLLNTPDLGLYAVRPALLRARARDLVRSRRLALIVTEDASADRVSPAMRRAHVLVAYEFPHRRIAEMPDLRWVHLISAGADHLLPFDWLPGRVALTNSSGVHADLAGEYAAAALLMLNIGIPYHAANQRARKWDQALNMPIAGKTAVIVGAGAIGGSAARQARRLGLRVVGVRWSGRPHPHMDEVHRPERLRAILPRADFLVVTAPLTPATRGMIGARELAALPLGASLVNMSRSALVDYGALLDRLERGALRGAILDVFDPEPPPPDSPLWAAPNLLITPHVSSDPRNYPERVAEMVVDNLDRLAAGRPLRNRVDPTRGY